jgi:DNA mismatch repair protein MutL
MAIPDEIKRQAMYSSRRFTFGPRRPDDPAPACRTPRRSRPLKRLAALFGHRDFEANACRIDQERDGGTQRLRAACPPTWGNAAHQYLFVNGRPSETACCKGFCAGPC